MKLDSDTAVLHPPLVHTPNSKSFQLENETMDPVDHKSCKEIRNGIEVGILCEMKGHENNVDTLKSEINDTDGFWPVSDFDGSESSDNLTGGNEIVGAPNSCSFEETELLKHLDVFTDKNVTECELPEVKACEKEDPCHEVKDICIDEGMIPKAKLFDPEVDAGPDTLLLPEDDVNSSSLKEKAELGDDVNSSSVKEKLELDSSASDVFEVPDGHCSASFANKCCPEELVRSCEAIDESEHEVSDEKIVALDRTSATESIDGLRLDTKQEHAEDSAHRETGRSCAGDTEFLNTSNPENGSCRIENTEATASNPIEVSAESSPASELAYNSTVETGSITFSFQQEGSVPNGQDLKNDPAPTTKVTCDCESQASSSRDLYNHGETSFSMAGPVSGLITYSGHIAYSGSVSLRSDSSTTSTRSFAFPILQSDWNSSPVRMAKADRRRYRRRKGWTHGLLCCRF